MTEDDRRSQGSSRWWLNPALARLAFGASTHGVSHHASVSIVEAMAHALAQGERLELDLADAAQRDFGEYELLERIGQGGMGMVFRARQRGLDREVAIKLLSAGQWAPEDLVESLRREAQHAARLQHPNIVIVHGIGEHAGLVYYAMQLVRGQSLSQKLDAEGPMPPRDAARLLRTIAEAVDYAHRLGVLHLDLKPGNLLIDAGGVPRIADFGLARPLNQALEERRISGTPSYMAPEQAQPDHAALSPATDVWALGAVLYEMLTGHPPFEADDPARTLQLLQHGTVRRPSRMARIPVDLEAICLHCLQRDPAQRYASVRALADDLGRFLEDRAVRVRPLGAIERIGRWARREPRLTAMALLAAVALLLGIAGASLQWQRAERNAIRTRELLWDTRLGQAWKQLDSAQPLQALSTLLANLREQTQAGSSAEAFDTRVRMAAVLAQSPRLIDVLPAGQPVTAVAIDPSGHWLALGTDRGQVQLFDADTGRRRWVAETMGATHFWQTPAIHVLDFASDGRHLVAGRPWSSRVRHPSGQDQVLIDLETGHVRLPPASRFPGFVDASYSPDGGYGVVRTLDPSGRRRAQLVRTDARWTALGPPVDTDAAGPLFNLAPGKPQVAYDMYLSTPGTLDRASTIAASILAVRAWSFAPDGKQLAVGLADGQVHLIDVASRKRTRIPAQSSVSVAALHYSADGRWLAVARDNGQAEVWDVLTGRALADPVRHGDAPFLAIADRTSNVLFTADLHAARIWQLPDAGGDITLLATIPISGARHVGPPWYGAAAYNAARGLLLTRQEDGQARLWRIRPYAVALPFAPPPLLADYTLDGRHLLASDGQHLQLRDAASLQPSSPVLSFPHPAGLTLPLPDGNVLVVSGRSVHLRELATGRPRIAPVDFDNTPVRLLANPAGGSWTASQLDKAADRSIEVIEVHTMEGTRVGRASLPGPLDALRYATNGKWLLAWRQDVLYVLDAINLQPLLRPISIAGGPSASITDAVLDAAGTTLWVATRETPRRSRLLAMDIRSGRIERMWPADGAITRLQALVQPGHLVMQTQDDGLFQFDRKLGPRPVSRETAALPMGVIAISGDGRRVAATAGGGVLVYSAQGRLLTPVLRMPALRRGDRVTQLLFDLHGEHLLARTLEGIWFRWTLAPTTTPLPRLQRELAFAQPESSQRRRAVTPKERALLRAGDPGPPPRVSPASTTLGDDMLEPRFVDLRPHCNPGGAVGWIKQDLVLASHWPVFPHGRIRVLGQDYEVRCAISTAMLRDYPQVPGRIAGLKPGLPRFAVLHVLMTGVTSLQDQSISPYAIFELAYRDGSSARLPVYYRRDVAQWWWDSARPGPVPALLGRRDDWHGEGYGLEPRVYSVDLRNPHPDREVASIALDATSRAWSRPAVLAMTLEAESSTPVGAGNQAMR